MNSIFKLNIYKKITTYKKYNFKPFKNCIFCCIFNNTNYISMFLILFESLCLFANLNNNIDIYLYTTSKFKKYIIQYINNSNFKNFLHYIIFEINDNYNTIDQSCKARIDFFNLKNSYKYNKILYLDTDIVINGYINIIFNLIQKDILYVLPEGKIDADIDYWGKSLFGNEINNYKDTTAFTSAILLFNNSTTIKNLFKNIKLDMIKRKHFFFDQPYIIYNAFKYNLYDNILFKEFACNYNKDNPDFYKIINHFPGGPGIFFERIEIMKSFLLIINSI